MCRRAKEVLNYAGDVLLYTAAQERRKPRVSGTVSHDIAAHKTSARMRSEDTVVVPRVSRVCIVVRYIAKRASED